MEEKNIKKRKIGLLIIAIFLLITIIFGIIPVIKKVYFSVCDKTLSILRPDNIILDFEFVYSQDLRIEITDFITEFFQENKIDKIDLLDFGLKLKNKFDFIKDIEWNFLIPGQAKLKIIGKQPLCFLNNQTILAQESSKLPSKYFNEYKTTVTKDLILEKDLSSKSFAFFNNVPVTVWENYTLDYRNKNNIFLMPKQVVFKQNCDFLLDRKTISDAKKLFLANKIVEDLYENKKLSIRKKYILDLRYENKILLKNKSIKR